MTQQPYSNEHVHGNLYRFEEDEYIVVERDREIGSTALEWSAVDSLPNFIDNALPHFGQPSAEDTASLRFYHGGDRSLLSDVVDTDVQAAIEAARIDAERTCFLRVDYLDKSLMWFDLRPSPLLDSESSYARLGLIAIDSLEHVPEIIQATATPHILSDATRLAEILRAEGL